MMNELKISAALNDFVSGLRGSGRSVSTIDIYCRTLRLLTALTGDMELHRFSETILSQALIRLENGYPHQARRSKATMNQIRSSIKTFFLWAFSSGIIPINPAFHLRLAKSECRPIRAISEKEIGLLLNAIHKNPSFIARRDEALLAAYAFSGLRRCEVLSLKIADLDFSRNRIWVSKTKTGTGEFKAIPIKLKSILDDYLRRRLSREAIFSSPFIFPGRNIHRPLSCREAGFRFEHWKKETGIRDELTLHSFRSGFATRVYEVTKDPVLVSKAMGHKNLASVRHYISINEDGIHSALEKAFPPNKKGDTIPIHPISPNPFSGSGACPARLSEESGS